MVKDADTPNGIFADEKTALGYFQFSGIAGSLVTFFASPLVGKFIDRCSPVVVTPVLLTFKSLVLLAFYFIPDPRMPIWACVAPFMAVSFHSNMMQALSY
jgi:predicted MFS family arabinose efflux permease